MRRQAEALKMNTAGGVGVHGDVRGGAAGSSMLLGGGLEKGLWDVRGQPSVTTGRILADVTQPVDLRRA